MIFTIHNSRLQDFLFKKELFILHFVSTSFSRFNALKVLNFLESKYWFCYFFFVSNIELKSHEDFILWLLIYRKNNYSFEDFIVYFSDEFFSEIRCFFLNYLKLSIDKKCKREWLYFSTKNYSVLKNCNIKLFFDYQNLVVFGLSEEKMFLMFKFLNIFLEVKGIRFVNNIFDIKAILDGFTIWNWNFRKEKNGYFYLRISSSSISNYRKTLKLLIKNVKDLKYLILFLNFRIQNWVLYNKKCSNALDAFLSLDNYLFRSLMRRFKKLYPNKSNNWIFKNHWKEVDGKNVLVIYYSRKKFISLISHFDCYRNTK